MSLPIQLNPGTIPEGYCPESWQALNVLMFGLASASINVDNAFLIISNSTPDVDDRDKVWFKTAGDGSPERIYRWWAGVANWIALHPSPASGDERRIWVGAEADLITFDGGSNATVSDAAGPMWEVDHDFDAKFMVGPGTFTSGATVAVDGTGGEEKHILTQPELPASLASLVQTMNNWSSGSYDPVGVTRPLADDHSESGATIDVTLPTITNSGGGTGHNNLPPYRGAFIIKRTARRFYTAS